MADIWRTTYRVGDGEYQVGISWEDGSFVEGKPSIKVDASVRFDDGRPSHAIDATLTVHDSDNLGPVLTLVVGDREVVSIPLSELVDESQIIDRIPAWLYGGGDPVTGCLLRAGLSAVVGQIIRCKSATRDFNWYGGRVRAIAECLRANARQMGYRAALRAARCVLSAGF